MNVADILKTKGTAVKSVHSCATALDLARFLRAEGIGAVLVSDDGSSIAGIISERDLAHGLAKHASHLPLVTVADLMTTAVITCAPDDTVGHVAKVMTQRRIRHLPVKIGDRLVGIVTIGDVLKSRLDEMELEANVLRDYAIARR